jgi:hypothetical protein
MKYLPLLVLLIFIGCATTTPEQKYSKTSTAELRLRHAQCEQFLTAEKKNIDIKFGPPLAMAMMGDGGRGDRIKEKEEIEKELLRRYQAGDKDAHIPIFQ